MQLWSQRKCIFITYLNNAANWINPQFTHAGNDLLWIGSVGPWRDIKQFSDSVHYEDVADASPEHSPFWRWAIWWVGFRGNQIVALSRPSGPGRCCHRLPLSPRWYPALREIWGIAWGERLEKQPVLPDLLYGYMKGEDTTIIWVECVRTVIQTRVRTELPFSDRPLQDRWSSWSGREVGGKPDGIVIIVLVIITTILIIIVIIIIILVFVIRMLIMISITIITLLS